MSKALLTHACKLAIEGRTCFVTFAFGEVIIIPVPGIEVNIETHHL